MEMLENIKYDKITKSTYEQRIKSLIQEETLKNIGLKKTLLGTTTFGYPLEQISIGHGQNEIFLIGGTHSSEIIGLDFITQLIEQLPNIEEFDPNLFKINIIPIQNPEGFDIITSLLTDIKEIDFEKKSKEYYLRYRTDALIYNALNDLNKLKTQPNFIEQLKIFIETNKNWQLLEKDNAMPKISILNNKIKKIEKTSNPELQLLQAIKETEQLLDKTNIHDLFLLEFLKKLKQYFILKIEIDLNHITKLHQQMFRNINITNLDITSEKLKQITEEIYKQNPKGSIINHDPTGLYINLNANQPNNPGLEIIRQNKKKYMTGTKSNLRNYYRGPMGIPCLDPNNFEFAIENQILYKILKDSQEKGNYVATLLYHGTGGMIYYKPDEKAMTEEKYQEYLEYNQDLADAYNEGINNYKNAIYKKIETITPTGYGDLLRKEFKGVLLIELSRMGGNPIGPYGDKNNIYNTINENVSGIKYMLKYLKQKQSKTAKKK